MPDKMSSLKKIPFFLLLLPLFFCLHGSVEFYGYLWVSEVIELFLLLSATVLLLFIIARYFSKSNLIAALVTFYIAAWNLFFGALHDGLKGSFLHFLSSYSVLLPLLVVSTIVLILILKRYRRFQPRLLYYLNIVLLIYCLYDGALLLSDAFTRHKKMPVTHVPFNLPAVIAKPDVYYLLFDGYPGYQSLQDSFGFKNEGLYSFLAAKGFGVLPSASNYNFTYFSMASVFNMNYLDLPHPDSIKEEGYLQQAETIRNGEVFYIFQAMGYSLKDLSIFDVGSEERLSNNELVPSHLQLLTHKMLYRKFMKEAGSIFLSGKYEIPFLKKFFLRKDDFNRRVEEKIYNTLEDKTGRPAFLYAHFFLPHEPIYFDSAGNYLPGSIIYDNNTMKNKNYYLGYIKYTNSRMMAVVNAIVNKDPHAIIVVMSDHGYRFYPDYAPPHFNNLCAVRFGTNASPGSPPFISNVNFFRYLFNTGFGQQLPFLRDSSIYLKDVAPVQ